jgi:small subunit ribosomal protein S4
MARYTGPKNKLSRREGFNLFGSSSRSLERRLNVPPGKTGTSRRRPRVSEYGIQLREKQKVKRMFGMMEKQFVRFFDQASRQPGNAGVVMLQLLERRLDNVIYRLGFGRTRPMARQLVNHGHVTVNGQMVSIPSYVVNPGDVIKLDERAQKMPSVLETLDEGRQVPVWLDRNEMTGRVLRAPYREEMEPEIKEELIVEFYSR